MSSGIRKQALEINCEQCGETTLWKGGRKKQYCSQLCGERARYGHKPRQPKEPGTLTQRHTQRSRQLKIDRGQCRDCKMQINAYNVVCIDWDHRDPSTKQFTISAVMGRTKWENIEAEIAKCDAVCRNCHAIRTHHNNHYAIPPRPQKFTASRGKHPKDIRYEQHGPATHNQ